MYEGIDIRYYFENPTQTLPTVEGFNFPSPVGRGRGGVPCLRYDFILAPGADPTQIKINFEGQYDLRVNENGELVYTTRFGEVKNAKLFAYQNPDQTLPIREGIGNSPFFKGGQGGFSSVPCRFTQNPDGSISFALGEYDRSKPLIIDPLVYSTFIGGGADDRGYGITLDSVGNAFITGSTYSANFPVTSGAYAISYYNNLEVFVTKLNTGGSTLIYSTFLGGYNTDESFAIALDGENCAYITGSTSSSDFPTTSGAFDVSYNCCFDAFITKLNASGSALIYSTYIGGSTGLLSEKDDAGNAIAIDNMGNAFITGSTGSDNFPTTNGAFDESFNSTFWDAFVTKLNADGTNLIYSTYIGGTGDECGNGIVIDNGCNAVITGKVNGNYFPTTIGAYDTSYNGISDVFVTKLNADGSALIYSTFIGGNNLEGANALALDRNGNTYITGMTCSSNFPTTSGAYDVSYNDNGDVFVIKLNENGSAPIYSTYIGGNNNGGNGDYAYAITIDTYGFAYITGETRSQDFPTTSNAYNNSYNGGIGDAFITMLNLNGTDLIYSSFLGGSLEDIGHGIALNPNGNVLITGITASSNFPTTINSYDTNINGGYDSFISILSSYSFLKKLFLISPANNSTDLPTNIIMNWYPDTDAISYNLQVATDAGFTSMIINQTGITDTCFNISSLNYGTQYFWRVLAFGDTSMIASSEFRKFTTAGSGIYPPSLLTPLNRAVDVSTTPYFSWTSVSGAMSYNIQVSLVYDFSYIIINQNISGDTTYTPTVPLANNTKYYWRVNAQDGTDTSPWLTIWSFTTIGVGFSAPTHITPANGTTGVSITPQFSWTSVPGATSYNIQVSLDVGFSSIVINQNVSGDTTFIPSTPITNNTHYFWRVNAQNNTQTSPWSAAWHFWTMLQIPNLITPVNNSTGVSLIPAFTWTAAPSAIGYTLQVSTNSDFNTTIINQTGINGTSFQPTTPLPYYYTTYYWRVSAVNSIQSSPWSSTWNFKSLFGAPILTSPADGATGVSQTPTFTWNEAIGAVSYNIQISVDSLFATPFINQIVGGTTYTPPVLFANNLHCYWRVNAQNTTETSPWSSVWNCWTFLPEPILIAPANNASATSLTPTFLWTAVPGATSYTLQISTSPLFSTTIINQTGISTTSYQLPVPLAYFTTYYWRVNAQNNYIQSSNWSSVWNFWTLLPVPTLISPANNATGVSLTPTFSWATVYGATNYTLQVSTDSLFTTTVINQTSIVGTSYQPTVPLTNLIKYYWRIKAHNTSQATDWSSVWHFTTIVGVPNAPNLVSPENNSTGIAINPTFKWNTVAGATSYNIQASTNSLFTNPIIANTTDTAWTPSTPLAYYTQYFWRVNANNGVFTSTWSSVWNFLTLQPINGETGFFTFTSNTGDNLSIVIISNYALLNGIPLVPGDSVGVFSPAGLCCGASEVPSSGNIPLTAWEDDPLTTAIDGLQVGETMYYKVKKVSTGLVYNVVNVAYSYPLNFNGKYSKSVNYAIIGNFGASSAPTLIAPENNTTVFSQTPLFVWTAVTEAASYTLQVSTTSDFSSIVINQNGLTDTTYLPTVPLDLFTAYYWRVQTNGSFQPSEWSVIWKFQIIISSPTLLSPANNSTGNALSPVFIWQSVTDAISYNIQVSLNSDLSSPIINKNVIGDTTYKPTVLLTKNTKYFWRVNAQNSSATSPWSDIWNFWTLLPAPTLLTPVNNATGVALSPIFTWTAVTEATSYTLQVSTDSGFINTIINQTGILGTTYQPTEPLSSHYTSYYWRVLASNSIQSSAWSSIWKFRTLFGIPVLIAPVNAASGVSAKPTFIWSLVTGALSYNIQVSLDPIFSTPIINNNVTGDTTYTPSVPLAINTQYYWRVNALNGTETSPWSEVWHFLTLLPATTLRLPENNATKVTLTPKFIWTTVDDAASYTLEVSMYSSFNSTVIKQSGINGTSYQVTSPFAYFTTYYWRVNAQNDLQDSPWSEIWNFRTLLSTPVLTAPVNNATAVTLTPTFIWLGASGAESYTLQVSIDSNFTTTKINQEDILGTSYRLTEALAKNTRYFCRVNARSGDEISPWSEIRRFTTTSKEFLAPMLITPFNGATGVSTTPYFSWTSVNEAILYNIQVSLVSDFSTTVINRNITGDTTYTPTFHLADNTQYYWRVNAQNEIDETSLWSEIWSFTTIKTGIPAPILLTPLNGATGVSVTPDFKWTSVSGATIYNIQVTRLSDFSTTVINLNITGDTTFTPTDSLAKNTQYYWRVNAKNTTDTSPWSDEWIFTTKNGTSVPTETNNIIGLTVTPNPASNKANISFSLTLEASVRITVTNSLGIEIARPLDGEIIAGNHQIEFDAEMLPSGLYYCTLRSGERIETIKLLIVK